MHIPLYEQPKLLLQVGSNVSSHSHQCEPAVHMQSYALKTHDLHVVYTHKPLLAQGLIIEPEALSSTHAARHNTHQHTDCCVRQFFTTLYFTPLPDSRRMSPRPTATELD